MNTPVNVSSGTDVSAFFPVLDRTETLRALMALLTVDTRSGMYHSPVITTLLAGSTARILSDDPPLHLANGDPVRRIAHNMMGTTFAIAALLREAHGQIPFEMTIVFQDMVFLGADILSILVCGNGPTKCLLVNAYEGDDPCPRSIAEIDVKTVPDKVNAFELELLALWFTSALFAKQWPGYLVCRQHMTFPSHARVTRGAICVSAVPLYSRHMVTHSGIKGTIMKVNIIAETACGIPVARGTSMLFLPSV